jgi:hypothetical protein
VLLEREKEIVVNSTRETVEKERRERKYVLLFSKSQHLLEL